MSTNVHLGDGVREEATAEFNSQAKKLVKIFIDDLFDYFESNIDVKSIPEKVRWKIKQLRESPETERKLSALWSEQLYKEGLIPKGYNGLPNDLLISNFRQEGYLDGLYVGYILAMMTLVDNNAPKDIIIATRDYIRPHLLKNHFDDRDKFINQYKSEKYRWVSVAN